MKRSKTKLMLASLMSVALISSNMSFVYATEETPAEASESVSSEEAVESEASQPESTGQEESKEQAESTEQKESAAQAESADQKESTEQTESAAQTEGIEEKESAETEDTEQTESAETESVEQTESAETEDSEQLETEQESEEDAETATEEEAGEELVFIDKDGNEMKPSSLVGVDYDTVAESYDGEQNVIKKYAESDEYDANVIMDSFVDEDGNLVILISQGAAKTEAAVETVEAPKATSYSLGAASGGDAPAVDGSFTGWDDIPASYEFNWNKPDAWVDGVHYTETNSTDVRHEMKLYSDGENVYLRVVFAREFSNGQVANGNDYQFWIDNQQMAAYQVQWPDGNQLSYNSADPGVYEVEVRHRDSSWSYVLTDGAVAYYHINEGNLNNELELKIPMSEFVKQNPNISLDNYNMISFFTPNLMQDKISAAGASTGAVPFSVVVFLAVPASYIWLKKKKEGELALA